MHRHVRRLLGVDLTGRDESAGEFTDYAAAAYGVLGEGMFTPEFAATVRDAFARARAPDEAATSTSTPTTDTTPAQGETA